MGIDLKNNIVKLTDIVTIDDAEILFNWLLEKKKIKVDMAELSHIHTAAYQILLVFKPKYSKIPENDLKIFFTEEV